MKMNWRQRVLLAAMGGCVLAAHASQEATYLGYGMGTLIQGTITASDQTTADRLVTRYEALLGDYETLFTVHGEGPLQEVNRRSGSWQATDCRIARLIESAKDIARDSGGAFDPTIGPVVNVWKIGFGGNSVPPDELINKAQKLVNWRLIETRLTPDETGHCRVRIGAGQQIDLGAIAKGWIGTAIGRTLQKEGAQRAILDLGGNIVLVGAGDDGRNWNIGVQDPRKERNEIFAILKADPDVSVITSGDYERYFTADGKTYGHILSGATGRPVPLAFSSVTIMDADGAKADGWCTALFAMGRENALAFLARRPDIRAFLISPDAKTAWVSEAIAQRLELVNKETKLNIIRRH